jgi:threonine dehydrogenase-like Zn-dependent dehydrogenase
MVLRPLALTLNIFVCSDRTVHHIPDNLSFEEATNIDNAATALHGVKRGMLIPGDDVAVFGPGAAGLLSFQFARALGAGRVFVIGRRERLALAEKMGAIPVDYGKSDPSDLIKGLTNGRGVDVAIDCAGTFNPSSKQWP